MNKITRYVLVPEIDLPVNKNEFFTEEENNVVVHRSIEEKERIAAIIFEALSSISMN